MLDNILPLQAIIKERRLDGFIITNPVNIFYLTGFRGVSPTEREAILVIRNHKAYLVTAKLYQQEARKLTSPALKVKIATERNQIFAFIQTILKNAQKVGFEEQNLTVAELSEFKKALPHTKLVPTKNFVEDLRVIKTADEILCIEKAQIISQKAFEALVKTLKTGQTEAEIAEKLAKIIKSLGGQGLAFESIVAAGSNAAKPHHITGLKRLATGDILLIDFGAKYQNYCADLTRTIFVGKVNTQKHKIYQLVAAAQKAAIDSITHGIKAHEPHLKVYQMFKKERLHGHFWHGLGHGIGLEVHEGPHLRPAFVKNTEEILKEGMVFSVEPGLYFPSWGGVRIEDLVIIKNGKAKVLGHLLQDLIVV